MQIIAMTHGQRGASIVEYALLVAAIALGSVIALSFMGDQITGLFEFLAEEIQNAPSP